MEVVRFDAQPAERVGAVDQMLRRDVPNLAFNLPNTVHNQQRCAESFASILLQQRGPEDDVRLTGVVFQS